MQVGICGCGLLRRTSYDGLYSTMLVRIFRLGAKTATPHHTTQRLANKPPGFVFPRRLGSVPHERNSPLLGVQCGTLCKCSSAATNRCAVEKLASYHYAQLCDSGAERRPGWSSSGASNHLFCFIICLHPVGQRLCWGKTLVTLIGNVCIANTRKSPAEAKVWGLGRIQRCKTTEQWSLSCYILHTLRTAVSRT